MCGVSLLICIECGVEFATKYLSGISSGLCQPLHYAMVPYNTTAIKMQCCMHMCLHDVYLCVDAAVAATMTAATAISLAGSPSYSSQAYVLLWGVRCCDLWQTRGFCQPQSCNPPTSNKPQSKQRLNAAVCRATRAPCFGWLKCQLVQCMLVTRVAAAAGSPAPACWGCGTCERRVCSRRWAAVDGLQCTCHAYNC